MATCLQHPGADLDKNPELIEAAYNDEAGITALFNKNILTVINHQLGGDFDLDLFSHRAFYDRSRRQVEMHLVSERRQTVAIRQLDLCVSFAAGESVRTEISRKFTAEQLSDLLDGAGLAPAAEFIDDSHPYALMLGRKI